MSRQGAVRAARPARIIAGVLCALSGAMARADDGTVIPSPAEQFATCAAYYFNLVNTRPMKEYETYYGAGERAFNEALKIVGRQQTDRLMGNASAGMSEMTGSNWANFARVEARYDAPCAKLDATIAR